MPRPKLYLMEFSRGEPWLLYHQVGKDVYWIDPVNKDSWSIYGRNLTLERVRERHRRFHAHKYLPEAEALLWCL